MKKLILIPIMILLATLSTFANDQSFYFIAKATNQGVYLRWDAVEGNFPKNSDIDLIVLKRNDVNISSFNPNDIMDIGQIEALYAKPSNQRSLKKIISSISKNDDTTCSGANLSNYASKIRACMQNNMWRYMASKVDFNIATIGYRAYLDTEATTNPTTYELVAVKIVNNVEVSQRLGKVVVNPNVPTTIKGAKNFKQIQQRKACNTPDYAKDDYTVALSWENGGEKTDAFANSIMLAGYDLYRVKDSENDIVSDLSTLMSTATVNANGDYVFAGLEKVNDVPLLLANSEGEEDTLFLETKDKLKKDGLKSGDKRWYYLIAKDFTGEYGGKIAKLQVTIPDLLAPQTPWGIRAIEHNKKVKLIWENVNVTNYVKHYKNSRKFCNIGTLSPKERLRFVDKNGTCGTKEIEVNLDVDKYYIYRFTNPAKASKFVDSDLDGIGDLDETKENVCKNNNLNGKFEPPLIKIIDANKFKNKEFITFVDKSVTDSKYYWYRVVAVRGNIGSIMSVPVRAMIPNRTLPNKVEVETKACSSKYIIASYSFDGNLDYLAYDKTGVAKNVRVKGIIRLYDGTILDSRGGIFLPVKENGLVDFPKKWGNCQFGTIEFLDERGNVLASKTLCSNLLDLLSNSESTSMMNTTHKCKAREFYVLNENDCKYNGLEKVNDGQDVYTFPIISFPKLKDNECLEITQIVNNKRYKRATICDKIDKYNTQDLNLSNLGKGEKFCLGVNILNENNQYSPTTYLPCFGVVDQGKPNRPDMRSIKVNGEDNITVAWISPQEKVTSTVVSLYNEENKSQSYLRTFSHPDHINKVTMDTLTMSRDITGILTPTNKVQKWCAKVKSIGFNGKTSEWSSEKCTQNLEDEEKENLAWPEIKGVNKLEDIKFSYYFDPNGISNNISTVLSEGNFTPVVNKSISKQIEEHLQYIALNFIFYRQSKKNINELGSMEILSNWSNFVQVSPLVDKIKVIKVLSNNPTGAGNIAILELENNLRVTVYYSTSKKISFAKWTLTYVDNYPFNADTIYRYVKVNFDKNHEIESYNVSNAVRTTQGGVQ